MSQATDPLFDALDDLARVADTDPVPDRMLGIRRKARVDRLRTAALVTAAVAAVTVAGVSLVATGAEPDAARDPGITRAPGDPASTDAAPTDAAPTEPERPEMVEQEAATADVDGDGTDDEITVLMRQEDQVPDESAIQQSADVWLRVRLADGETGELRLPGTVVPDIEGAPDLNGDGAAEVVLGRSSGDLGLIEVLTWDGEGLLQVAAVRPDGAPVELVADGVLQTVPGVTAAVLDGDRLVSWVPVEPGTSRVRVWEWRLQSDRLVAEEAGVECFDARSQRLGQC